MPKRKRFEKEKEPFIVCVDDLEGGFEIVGWFTTEDEAIKEYESWEEEYDTDNCVNHIWDFCTDEVDPECFKATQKSQQIRKNNP